MKEGIHPDFHECTVTCACGHVIHTLSTDPSYTVAICSKCHPYFTGKTRLVDTEGRIERFRKRYQKKTKG